MDCVETGTLIKQTEHVKKYYKKLTNIVGVCSGEETEFIYAEWHDGGAVHGRPISIKKLKQMKVIP